MKPMVCAILVLFAACAAAAEQTETLRLRHRSPEEAVDALRPLLEKGGSLAAAQDAILVQAGAENRARIRQALAAFDTVPRRLVVEIRQDNAGSGDCGVAACPDAVRPHADPARRSQEWSSRGAAADRASHRVQVMEGSQAYIATGYSFPLRLHRTLVGAGGIVAAESVAYRDTGSGFHVRPRLRGSRVTVEISLGQSSLSPTEGAAVRSMDVATTVSGRLGEWIKIGGAAREEGRADSGPRSYATRGDLNPRRILLRVEEVP
jgi:type II secretory pathway component GspD/PulD (secretin)